MKRGRSPVAISIIALCLLLAGLGNQMAFCATVNELDSMTLVAENEYLRLYINEHTTAVAVADKQTDMVWYTNPPNWAKEERRAKGATKNRLGSQLAISYYIPGDERRTMDNYNDSIVHGQFDIFPLENGVRVEYVIGEQWSIDAYVPKMISADAFESLILSRIISEKDRRFVRAQFTLVTLEKLGDRPRIDVFGVDKQKTFGDYTLISPEGTLNDGERRKLIESFVVRVVASRNDMTGRGDVKFEDIAQLVDNPTYVVKELSNWDKDDLVKILKQANIDAADIQANNLANNLDPLPPNITVFTIPLEYRLDGSSLVVKVPTDEVTYPVNAVDAQGRYTVAGNQVTLPLHTVEVLPFFGAASIDDKGYMLVPDGCGALIELNSGKEDVPAYNQGLYGRDHSLGPRTDRLSFPQQSYLPVFGMVKEDAGFLGIIEKGDALAQIRAAVSGRQSSYNTVAASFITIPTAKIVLSEESATTDIQHDRGIWLDVVGVANAYQPRIFDGNIEIRYEFLGKDATNYAGMARVYRSRLMSGRENIGSSGAAKEDIPLILELTGAIHTKRPVLGVPRRVIEPLTTFQQVADVVDELQSAGIGSIKIKYTGWLSGGVEHSFPEKVVLDPRLGTKKDFQELVTFLQREGISFYPAVGFLHRYGNALFDGFRPRRDGARFLDRQVAIYHTKVIDALQLQDLDKYHYIVSPNRLDALVGAFLDDFKIYGIGGIHLSDVGTVLNSDFRQKALIDRQQAKGKIGEQVERLFSKENLKVMVSGGNGYVLPYVDTIVDLPMTSSSFLITTRDVPFLPMVLSGYVDYSYAPINYSNDIRKTILKSIETGALPYFSWIYQDPVVIKDTDFNTMYSGSYQHWLQEAINVYHELNPVLKEVYGQSIVEHLMLEDNVFKTVFANGRITIVNYNDYAVDYEGTSIPAKGYLLVGGI